MSKPNLDLPVKSDYVNVESSWSKAISLGAQIGDKHYEPFEINAMRDRFGDMYVGAMVMGSPAERAVNITRAVSEVSGCLGYLSNKQHMLNMAMSLVALDQSMDLHLQNERVGF